MNWTVFCRAWHTDLQPTPKVLLLTLALLVDDDGSCAPSISTLAGMIGVLPETIRGALKTLESRGFIRIRRQRGCSSIYHFQPQWGRE